MATDLAAVFQALADPVRLDVVQRLSEGPRARANWLMPRVYPRRR